MSLFVTVHPLQTSDISLESLCVFWPSVILSMSQELCVLFFLPHVVILCLLFCPWLHLFLSQILNLFIVILCLCGVYLDLFCMSLMSLNHDLVPPWPCFGCPHNVYNCIIYIVLLYCVFCAYYVPFFTFQCPLLPLHYSFFTLIFFDSPLS